MSISLSTGDFILNEDVSGGVVLPYELDGSGAPRLVFQISEGLFPPTQLPSAESEIAEILADPGLRKTYGIVDPHPVWATGTLSPRAADQAYIPELGTSESQLIPWANLRASKTKPSRALDGRDLELMRRRGSPRFIDESWVDEPATRPWAVVPVGPGLEALVLDAPKGGAWMVARLRILTGEVLEILAVSEVDATATALHYDESGEAVLVADHVGDEWSIQRIDLTSDEGNWRVSRSDVGGPRGVVRDLAAVDGDSVLLTVGDGLLCLDADDRRPTITTILAGLAQPEGIVRAPWDRNRVFVAERAGGGTGRLLSVNLKERTATTVGTGLPRPSSVALVPDSLRILVVTDEMAGDGMSELRCLDIGQSSEAAVLGTELPGEDLQVAAGESGLRLVCSRDRGRYLASGGVEQRHAIASYSRQTSTLTLETPFDPPAVPGQAWRVAMAPPTDEAGVVTVRSPSSGRLVWRPEPSHIDIEGYRLSATLIGKGGESGSLTPTKSRPIEAWATSLHPPPSGRSATRDLVLADMDDDGDLDVVSLPLTGGGFEISWQTTLGAFEPSCTAVGNEPAVDLEIADMDNDGHLDIVLAEREVQAVSMARNQGDRRIAEPVPIVPRGTVGSQDPVAVDTVDLDGDGDLDVVVANRSSGTVATLSRTRDGSYDTDIALDGLLDPTDVVAADVNRDGSADLITTSLAVAGGAEVIVAHGRNATFERSQVTAVEENPIALGAFDRSSPGNQETLWVAALLPSGFLRVAPSGGTSFQPVAAPVDMALADVTGDGSAAVLLTSGSEAAPLEWSRLVGLPDWHDIPAAVEASVIDTGDLDGDGDVDVVLASTVTPNKEVLIQTRRGGRWRFGRSVDLPIVATHAVDLDGDGDRDLVGLDVDFGLPEGPSNTRAVVWQRGPQRFSLVAEKIYGYFSHPTGHPLSLDGVGFAVADLDADGDLDVVAVEDSRAYDYDWPFWKRRRIIGLVAHYLQPRGPEDVRQEHVATFHSIVGPNPSQPHSDEPSFDPAANPLGEFIGLGFNSGFSPDFLRRIHPVDMNGDGRLDLVIDRGWYSNFSEEYLMREPEIIWQRESRVTSKRIPEGVVDFPTLDPWQRDEHIGGRFRFGGHTMDALLEDNRFSIESRGTGLHVADLDADGAADLFMWNEGGQIEIHWQVQPDDFEVEVLRQATLTPGTPAQQLISADMNDDGWLDIVWGDRILFQRTARGFDTEPVAAGLPIGTTRPIIADFDGDGDLDTAGEGVINWQGLPGRLQPQPSEFDEYPLAAEDVDGDGSVDLLLDRRLLLNDR